jgi:formate/nitrite transporter
MGNLSPFQIVQETEKMAQFKVGLTSKKTLLLAMLAGIYIAIGGTLSVMTGFGFTASSAGNPVLQRMIMGATFPLGLILIFFVGAELFTGNNAVLIPAWLNKKYRFTSVLKNWGLVYLGNFIGVVLFSYIMIYSTHTLSSEPYHTAIVNIAKAKVSMPWMLVFTKAIGANWLVCLALWLGISAKGTVGKMIGLWFPIFCFVILGYEHSIANMFFISTGIFEGADISLSAFFLNNLVPATLGNILGGAFFVGGLYWYIYRK